MNLQLPTLWVASWSLLFGAGALAPLLGRSTSSEAARGHATNLAILCALLGSVAGVIGALAALIDPGLWSTTITLHSFLGSVWSRGYLPEVSLQIKVDPLSAVFALLIAAFAAIVAVYSFDALRAPYYRRQRTWIAGAFNVFIWATLLVVVVNDLFFLIVALEVMTLAFAGLTLYKHDFYQEPQPPGHEPGPEELKDARLAPQVYLGISHVSTAFLLLAILLLVGKAKSFSYDDILRPEPMTANLVFLLALAGLGIRAGLTPAHFWVPLVHPCSPTTTHAFSLGIAIKVAIYLMIRFFFQFLEPEVWWGYLVLFLGVLTAIVNVWYASASHDLKKALAYHSVENIGIMVAAVGAALIYSDAPLSGLSILALTAALLHVLNHAVFKGLLYLGTGSIERQTDRIVDTDRLGGLLSIWPWTGLTFLIGAFAIAGFPPFNGFVSEWLTLQALLKGPQESAPGSLMGNLALVAGTMGLFVAFALTAFCFVKIAGLALLGMPRAKPEVVAAWRQKGDVPIFMRSMMALLAALCLLLGLFPGGVIHLLNNVSATTLGDGAFEPLIQFNFGSEEMVALGLQLPTAMPAYFLVAVAIGFIAVLISRVRLRGRRQTLEAKPWACGTPYSAAEMQYTSAALTFLIRDLFGAGWAPRKNPSAPDYLPAKLVMSEGAANRSPRARQVVMEITRLGYNQFIHWLRRSSVFIETTFQNGDLRRYLLYILLANLAAMSLFALVVGN